MATYKWSVPTGKAITGTTYIKDTDNNIADTISDLVDFVNGEGSHLNQGLTYDMVDKASAQTITGVKTFTNGITSNVTGNLTGNVTGNVTGNASTATKLKTARTIAGTSFDGSANININYNNLINKPDIFSSGMIIMWSGSIASIPSGWFLCDGNNGTPNLKDRMIIGAGSTYSVGATGGSKDAIAVNHAHTFSATTSTKSLTGKITIDGGITSGTSGVFSESGDSYYIDNTSATGAFNTANFDATHNHTVSGTTSYAGSSGTNANLPPYYALAFIMKA